MPLQFMEPDKFNPEEEFKWSEQQLHPRTKGRFLATISRWIALLLLLFTVIPFFHAHFALAPLIALLIALGSIVAINFIYTAWNIWNTESTISPQYKGFENINRERESEKLRPQEARKAAEKVAFISVVVFVPLSLLSISLLDEFSSPTSLFILMLTCVTIVGSNAVFNECKCN